MSNQTETTGGRSEIRRRDTRGRVEHPRELPGQRRERHSLEPHERNDFHEHVVELEAQNQELREDYKFAAIELRNLEESNDGLHDERKRLERVIDSLQNRVKQFSEAGQGLQAERKGLLSHMRNLEGQVVQFKQAMSAAGATQDFASDDDIGRAFNMLFLDMESWAVNVVHRCKVLKFYSSSDVFGLAESMPNFPETENKQYMIRTIVCILASVPTQFYAELHFFGRDDSRDNTCAFTQAARMLAIRKVNAASFKKWLVTTRELLETGHPDYLSKDRSEVGDSLADETVRRLQAASDVEVTEDMKDRLRIIMQGAVDIADMLLFHPAFYQISFPPASQPERAKFVLYDPDIHEVMSGAKDKDPVGSCISAVFFPLLEKFRDEDGESMQPAIVSKAKVLISHKKIVEKPKKEEHTSVVIKQEASDEQEGGQTPRQARGFGEEFRTGDD